MAYLRVNVHFLGGHYHGQEWPPAPMRVFQALVAAGANSGLLNPLTESLRKLESMGPPRILAERLLSTDSFTAYVPRNSDDITLRQLYGANDSAAVFADRRARYDGQPTTRRWVQHPVSYEWELTDPEIEAPIRDLCDELTCLGRAEDMAYATADVVSFPTVDAARASWSTTASKRGTSVELRTTTNGSLDSLFYREQARRARTETRMFPSPPILYLEVPYRAGQIKSRRPAVLFDLMWPDHGPWRATRGKQVAAMVRHALGETARGVDRGYLMGHAPSDDLDDRLSWVPLPSLGHEHVDGRIRRVAVVGPVGESLESDRFRALVHSVRSAPLRQDGKPIGRMTQAENLAGAIKPYFGESAIWHSVTPVVLPGRTTRGRRQKGQFDRRKLEKLILKAVRDAGLPDPINFSYQAAPFERSGQRADTYSPLDRMRGFTRIHVKFQFPELISGPVIIGVGRHYGLGLLRAVEAS